MWVLDVLPITHLFPEKELRILRTSFVVTAPTLTKRCLISNANPTPYLMGDERRHNLSDELHAPKANARGCKAIISLT